MRPGPTLIKACPHCATYFSQGTFNSRNTFGANHWTDGKLDAPMFPEVPRLATCPQCRGLIWLAQIAINEEATSKLDQHQRAQIPSYAEASEDDLRKALLSVSNESVDELRYILVQLWWRSNDPTRMNPTIDHTQYTEIQRGDMARLYGILSIDIHYDRILKAELARELGWFKEASELIRDEFPTNLKVAVFKIRDLIQRRLTRVVILQ